jgi:hypothetical protein
MLRVTTEWTSIQGGPYYSTFYFDGDTEGEGDAAVAAVADWWGDWVSTINANVDATVRGETEIIDPATGQITGTTSAADVAVPMSGSGDMLPLTTQALIRWRTGVFVNGREIRGRTFIPGLEEPANAAGRPLGTLPATVQPRINDFLTASAGGGGLVVYSPTNGQAAFVNSGSMWNQWAVLRSRRD